jgi:small subunit ribosomal protein S16
MIKIRLRRVGARNKPAYRIVVADSRSPRDGAFIEIIGHYNPLTEPETVVVNEERAVKWLSYGARPTNTVSRLLSKSGVMQKFQPKSEEKSPPRTIQKTRTKAAAKAESTAEESTK